MAQLASRTIVAKLLANENISLTYGNYPTAWFDVESRELGLPQWKVLLDETIENGKDLADLLIGHEVGHALYTPAEGWHESDKEIPGCPRSFINVIEDIRIEKLVQAKYPGLVSSFKRGYKKLFDDDFFGVEKRDVNTLGLIDRINIKSKLRDLVEVPFSSKEQPYVDQAMAVTTWEDVIEACRAIYEFLKEECNNKEGNDAVDQQQYKSPMDSGEVSESQMGDVESSENAEQDREETEATDGMGPNNSTEESDGNSSESKSKVTSDKEPKGSEDSNEYGDSAGYGSDGDITRVVTDESFRNRESELIEGGENDQPIYVKNFSNIQIQEMIIPNEKILEGRKDATNGLRPEVVKEMFDALDEKYRTFTDETKKVVGVMAKEFEMRKAAYRSIRAQTARSGSLNVDKLYNYKFTDDIFKRVTTLADAKSHGMVMMIDYSGSMNRILGDVIKQTLNLVTFCKKVGIPFEVYGFTSGGVQDQRSAPRNHEIEHRDIRIIELLSSSMKKAQYEEAYKGLFYQTANEWQYWVSSRYESLGGTPLTETLIVSDMILDRFKAKHGIQKVNFVLLTDGDGASVRVRTDNEWNSGRLRRTEMVTFDLNGKKVCVQNSNATSSILNHIRNKGTKVLGFFLAERTYDFRGAIYKYSEEFVDTEKMNDYSKMARKNKFVHMDEKSGYDRLFIVKCDRSNLNTDADEFEVNENASKAQITRAFKKHNGSKKTNRLLSTKFAEVVAA